MPLNSAGLLVILEEGGRLPLRVRLTMALRDAVRTGQASLGSTLPSSRVLARDLGISRGVVLEAYAQLTAEGYLRSRPGAGTTVAATQPHARPVAVAAAPQHEPAACWNSGRARPTCPPFPGGCGSVRSGTP